MISHITPRVGVDCLRGRSYRRDNFRSLGPRGKVCFLLSQSALWWQQPNLGGQLIIRGTAHASGTPTDSIGQSATFHNPELWDVHNPQPPCDDHNPISVVSWSSEGRPTPVVRLQTAVARQSRACESLPRRSASYGLRLHDVGCLYCQP